MSSIVLLLVSAQFMAGDENYDLIKRAVAKHNPPYFYVVPILLSASSWQYTELGELEPFPSDGNPINTWGTQANAYQDVVEGIYRIVRTVQGTLRKSTSNEPDSGPNLGAGSKREQTFNECCQIQPAFFCPDRGDVGWGPSAFSCSQARFL